jgi:hypothetical protein
LIIKWAHLGSNQGPPEYEFHIGISTGLHRFVSLCASISYNTLKVKYYTGLHGFVEILAQNLAPVRVDSTGSSFPNLAFFAFYPLRIWGKLTRDFNRPNGRTVAKRSSTKLIRLNVKCISSGGLRNTPHSNRDEVGANYKLEYLLLHPPLLIHIVCSQFNSNIEC